MCVMRMTEYKINMLFKHFIIRKNKLLVLVLIFKILRDRMSVESYQF